MKIYHGSDHVIEVPKFGEGKRYNDYGVGFYCTESKELAKEWAVREEKSGFANAYELNMDGLQILNLNSPEYTILHWLTILLKNRTFSINSPMAREGKRYLIENFSIDPVDRDETDLIVGYRADDSYFSFAQDFLNGTISVRQLANAMKLGKLGEQIVLKSAKAFSQIGYLGSEYADYLEWYTKSRARDRKARKDYFEMSKDGYVKGDIYLYRLIDEEMKADDPRLR